VLPVDSCPRAIQLNGTVGSGKTTTADAIGELLAARGIPYAVIDLDWLRNGGPAPADDPFNERIGLRNLAPMVDNYRSVGTQRFVLAGVVETTIWRRRYQEALGMPLTVVRLQVDLEDLRQRLIARHSPGGVLDWHLHRSGELHTILTDAAVDDVIIGVGHDDPARVAARVLDAIGWLS
jgi:hypothetical protein